MKMLNNAKKYFGFSNVWTLDGRIYLAEGSTKPQIFKN